GAFLDIQRINGYAGNDNQTYTIINHAGSNSNTGSFIYYADSDPTHTTPITIQNNPTHDPTKDFIVGNVVWSVNYNGGDGNDVVLTLEHVPANTPDHFVLTVN